MRFLLLLSAFLACERDGLSLFLELEKPDVIPLPKLQIADTKPEIISDQESSTGWHNSTCLALTFYTDMIVSIKGINPVEVTQLFLGNSRTDYSNCPKDYSKQSNSSQAVSIVISNKNETETFEEVFLLHIRIQVAPYSDLGLTLRITFAFDSKRGTYKMHQMFIQVAFPDTLSSMDTLEMTPAENPPTSAPIGTYSSCNSTTWSLRFLYRGVSKVDVELLNAKFQMRAIKLGTVREEIRYREEVQADVTDVCIPSNVTSFFETDVESEKSSVSLISIIGGIGTVLILIGLIFAFAYHVKFTRKRRGAMRDERGSSESTCSTLGYKTNT